MFELYTPAPFPSPFGPGFDPRGGVHEVVERQAHGGLRVVSYHKRVREVPSARVAPGFEPKPGDRVSGVEEPGAQVEPVQPNPHELAYAQRWLSALTEAGLVIEGLDLHVRLRARLRAMPFGATPPRPLRPVLREWLDELVGRYPEDSWRSGNPAELARALLASLGVDRFTAPSPDASAQGSWRALLPTVAAANRALAATRSPLRWVACEQELALSVRASMSEVARANQQEPVWLVLVPATLSALEERQILRRYRGAEVPDAPAAPDPRVLRPRPAAVAPGPARPAAPPEKPCFATVRAVFEGGSGELIAEDGRVFRFGRRACHFTPEVGMRAWIVAFVAEPDGQYAAAIVHHETDRKLVDLMLKTRRTEQREALERALLARYVLAPDAGGLDAKLDALTPRQRQELAADLVELKRTSHVYDRVFTWLATREPAVFHPFLDQLDWRTEPELLAWADAPYRSVERAVEILARGTASALLAPPVPVGTLGIAIEMARHDRAPRSEVAAAALALAHSGAPEALAALARWIRRSKARLDEVNALIAIAGWWFHAGGLRRIWGQRPAFRARPDPHGTARHFVASDVACPSCHAPLLEMFEGAPRELLPVPVVTCANCARFGIYTVAVSRDGTPSPRSPLAPGEVGPRSEPWPPAVAIAFEPAPRAVQFGGEHPFDEVVRVGGAPTWSPTRGPLVRGLRCPGCETPLEFLAQFTHPLGWNPGLFYAFGCAACRIAATAFENY